MQQTVCFVLMPFRPEFNYFYLFLKGALEEKYGIRVERGDTKVLTQELMKKVADQITGAAFLIADITGNNPNVFFEIGIAYAKDKPIIFLTQDPPKDAPVDIRQYEFIHHDLNRHEEFLSKLDNAIRNVLGARLEVEHLYEAARELLRRFNEGTGHNHVQISRDEFQDRLVRSSERQRIPSITETSEIAAFLLPRILSETSDVSVMERITEWLRKQ